MLNAASWIQLQAPGATGVNLTSPGGSVTDFTVSVYYRADAAGDRGTSVFAFLPTATQTFSLSPSVFQYFPGLFALYQDDPGYNAGVRFDGRNAQNNISYQFFPDPTLVSAAKWTRFTVAFGGGSMTSVARYFGNGQFHAETGARGRSVQQRAVAWRKEAELLVGAGLLITEPAPCVPRSQMG